MTDQSGRPRPGRPSIQSRRSGAEPVRARSVYRTRLVLAGFGLVVAVTATVTFAGRVMDDGRPAEVAAAVFFAALTVVALINIVVVGRRWRNDQANS